MNKNRILLLILYILCIGFAPLTAETTSNPRKIEYTEWDGKTVHLPHRPKRTVVLYNSLLELWLYCNGTAVARVQGQQNLPATAHDIEVLGSVGHPNIERMVELNPDMVILSANMRNHRKIRQLLEENNITTLMVRYDHYRDFYRIADLFARINGSENEIGPKLSAIKEKINAIGRACKTEAPPTVLVLFSSANALSCELSNGDTGKLVELLGGKNIARTIHIEGVRRVDINLEFIARRDPDVILIKTMGKVEKCRERIRKEFARNPAWSQIKAVRTNRVHVLPKTLFLYKPNHRYPVSLEYLANLLYPGKNRNPKGEGAD
jgi:iron complex transport system substrate-binding protein